MDTPPAQRAVEGFAEDLKDYSATVLDVKQSVHQFLWHRHPLYAFCTIVVPPIVGVFILYLEFTYGNLRNASNDALNVAFFIALSPLIIPLISYARVYARMKKLFYTGLASTLGCSYAEYSAVPQTGQIFSFGHDRTMSNVLSGTYKNQSLRLADYSYVEGSGKNRRTYLYTIGELALNRKIPKILCKPNSWNDAIFTAWKPSGYKELQTEAEFDAKFTVYIPEDQEVEALQILEPNVMLNLMDGFEGYGFECIDTHIYLFASGTMQENREKIIAFYALLKRFCDVLMPELQSFLRETPATLTT